MVNIDRDAVASIFDVSSEDVSVAVEERSHGVDEEPLEKLNESGILPTTSGTKVTVEVSVSGETICEIDYMIFGDVGYIHWTSVPDEHQNKGIATTVREGVIEDLISRSVSVIYSYPASETGMILARNQGFEQTDDLSHGFGSWMKRSI